MANGYRLSDAKLKQPVKKGLTDYVMDFGKQAYDIAADTIGGYRNWVDQNQIQYNQQQANHPLSKLFAPNIAAQNQSLQAGINTRQAEGQQRTQDLYAIKQQNKGLATALKDKAKVVRGLVNTESKEISGLKTNWESQGQQALSAYEKQLKEDGVSPEDIASAVQDARSQVTAGIQQMLQQEAGKSKDALKAVSGGNFDDQGAFNTERNLNKLDKAAGIKTEDFKDAKSYANETFYRTIAQPATNLVGEIGAVGAGLGDLVSGNRFGLGKQLSAQKDKLDAFYTQQLGQEENLGNVAQSFVGNALPYMALPETKLAQGAGIAASKGFGQGLGRSMLRAGVKEAVQDAPLSMLSTAGQLTQGVQSGDITAQQALQQAPGAFGANALMDVGGAGLLKGAGNLIKNGIKAPVIENPPIRNSQMVDIPNLPESSRADVFDVKAQLQEQLLETQNSIQERLADVGGEKALLGKRSAARLKALESKEKELQFALAKREPRNENLTDKAITAKVAQQAAAQRLKGVETERKAVEQAAKQASKQEVVQAKQDIQSQYSDNLSNQSQLAEKPVRDGLEELGFEIRTNKSGQNYATFGNVKISLNDMPPPYSMGGLKADLKERIAKAKAASDIKEGAISTEGIKSEFLDNQSALDELNKLEEKSIYEESQFIDSIKKADSPEKLNQIAETRPDLFEYDASGKPSKYLAEFEAREKALANPAPVKELGTKNVTGIDGSKQISRTLGNYTPVEFQEAKRNPAKLNTINEVAPRMPKEAADLVDVISDLSKSRKVAENTIEDVVKAMDLKFKQLNIKPEDYSYKGIQVFPNLGESKKIINSKGQKIVDRYERMLEYQGLGQRLRDSDAKSLSVQPNVPRASKARIAATNTLDDLAEQLIQAKAEFSQTQKQYKTSKDYFMKRKAEFMDNDGLDTAFRNSAGDTAFHISRPDSKFEGEGKELLGNVKERLKGRKDTSKNDKPSVTAKLQNADSGKGVNVSSKLFKEAYEELQAKVDTKSGERLSNERSSDVADLVARASKYIEKDLEAGNVDPEITAEFTKSIKKLNKQFSFNAFAIPVIGKLAKGIIEGNGIADTLELAYNAFPVSGMMDKFFKNAKFSTIKDAAFEFVFNVPKTIDQEILSVKNIKNEKFIAGIQRLEARKMMYESKLADKNEDMFKEVQDLLDKHQIDDVLDADGQIRPQFENSKAADALAELADRKREMVEYTEDFKDDLQEQKLRIEKKIEKLEKAEAGASTKRALDELKSELFDIDKTLVHADNKLGMLKAVMNGGILDGVQSVAYKAALMWNPGVAFLNVFDFVNIRSAPELQSGKGLAKLANIIPFLGEADKAIGQILTSNLAKNQNSILHFMTADKRGSYYNTMSNASKARKAGKDVGAWVANQYRNFEDLDPNKKVQDFLHDVTVVASARTWKADNPQFGKFPDPVTQYREFAAKAPMEAQVSLNTKLAVDLGLIAGRGSKGADFAIAGLAKTSLGRSLLSFIKPVYRITNSLRRASLDVLDGANGFKQLDNGTFEFDVSKVNTEKVAQGVSSLISNVGGMYLVGGSTALVGLPVAGAAMNFLVRAFVPEEDQETWKENFNKFSLANKKLFPNLGNRIQLQNREMGQKDSVMGLVTKRIKQVGSPVMANYIENVGKAIDYTHKAFEEGNVDKAKLFKKWAGLLPAGSLLKRVKDIIGEEVDVYPAEMQGYVRSLGKVKSKGNVKLFLNAGDEASENLRIGDKVKEKALKEAKAATFIGAKGQLTPKFSKEGYARFKRDVDKYMEVTPSAVRSEVESKILAKAKTAYLELHPGMKKATKVKRYKPQAVLVDN